MINRKFLAVIVLTILVCRLQAQERYVADFSVSGNSLPAIKTISLPEPGYLVAELDSASGSNGIRVSFIDSVIRRHDINESRLDFPGNVTLNIHQQYNYPYNGNVNLKIKFYPIDDVLEPNDKAEQAAVINHSTWYSVNIFPYTDHDNFLVELKKNSWINPLTQPGTISLRWQLLNEKGEFISDRFPFFGSAGKYILKLLSAQNISSFEPVTFQVNLLPEMDQLEPNDTTPVVITKNKFYPVSLASPSDIDNFSIKTKGAGYLTIKTAQAPAQSVLFSCTINGKEFRGNPLVIPAGASAKTDIKMMAGTHYYNRPFFIIAEENTVLDPAEPNDSLAAAIAVTKSKGVYFSIFPSGDEDWFRVRTTGPGRIILNVFDALESQSDLSRVLRVELYDTAKHSIDMGGRNTDFGIIWASEYLKQAGDWYIRIAGNTAEPAERLLAMRIFGPNVSGNAGTGESFDDIYFIGFELDTSANNMLTALSETTDSKLFMVDSTGSLEQVLYNVFEEAKKRKRASLWWIIGLGIVAGLGTAWWYRKRGKHIKK